jgi:Mn-dependent DtxR family transcriptional regulator
MILERILAFLAVQKVASLTEIAHAVGASPDAAHSMMQTLQRKGLVHRYRQQPGCGVSCTQCGQGSQEIYGHGAEAAPTSDAVHCEVLDLRS